MTYSLTGFINNGSGTTAISDPDTNAVKGGIHVTSISGAGTWAYSLGGTDFTPYSRFPRVPDLYPQHGGPLPPADTVQRNRSRLLGEQFSGGHGQQRANTTAHGGARPSAPPPTPPRWWSPAENISGFVYVDTDNDGLRIIPDDGQAHLGLPGVIVRILGQGSSTATATVLSDCSGSYHFDNLPAGTYSRSKETARTLPTIWMAKKKMPLTSSAA